MPAPFTESMASHVLEHDDNSIRFEDFCVELFRDVDQVEYARTSKNYDLGRDAIGASVRSGPNPPLLACSLRSDILKKFVEDVTTIIKTAAPKTLVVCSARTLTEHLANELETELRAKCPSLDTIRIHGQERLTQLSMRYSRAMEDKYAAELSDLKYKFRQESTIPEDLQLSGLRIALTTQLHQDSLQRRADLLQNLILSSLLAKDSQTDVEISRTVSTSLHLPRAVNINLLSSEIDFLLGAGHIAVDSGKYTLTQAGQRELSARHERLHFPRKPLIKPPCSSEVRREFQYSPL